MKTLSQISLKQMRQDWIIHIYAERVSFIMNIRGKFICSFLGRASGGKLLLMLHVLVN